MKDYVKQLEESLNKLSPEELQKLDNDIRNSYGESVSVDEYLTTIKMPKSIKNYNYVVVFNSNWNNVY